MRIDDADLNTISECNYTALKGGAEARLCFVLQGSRTWLRRGETRFRNLGVSDRLPCYQWKFNLFEESRRLSTDVNGRAFSNRR